MSVTATVQDIFTGKLFWVTGDLVDNYNRALEKVIGRRTALSSFHLDKRGESPEIETELGQNYLQSGPAHRYCIILSPDQKHAGLIHEEFSFDHDVLDFLYNNYLSVISLATRVDSLYGELDDSVREYETLEDLLLIKKIQLELHTPSGFLTKARTLQGYVKELEQNADLLIRNESALLRNMLDLISDVGDVRSYDLSPIQATKELTTFFTRVFGGVCVFRDFIPREALEIKRPDVAPYLSQRLGDTQVAIENLPINLLDNDTSSAAENSSESSSPGMYPKTVVIYQQKDYQPEDGPLVTFIPFHEKVRVSRFLVEHGYADYSYDLVEQRLSRLEDVVLLQKGYDVTAFGKEQRLQKLHDCQDAMLPEWHELKTLKRNITKGHRFSEIVQSISADAQSMLLAAVPGNNDTTYVVEHLLTRLYEYDYESMYMYNKRHVDRLYENADEHTRKYILQVVAAHT